MARKEEEEIVEVEKMQADMLTNGLPFRGTI